MDNQAQRNVREQRRLELTGREVASLPEGTRTFRSVGAILRHAGRAALLCAAALLHAVAAHRSISCVGKAFMQYERAEVVASLQEERAELEKETKTLEVGLPRTPAGHSRPSLNLLLCDAHAQSQRTYMMRQQRECEANLRELAASLMRG